MVAGRRKNVVEYKIRVWYRSLLLHFAQVYAAICILCKHVSPHSSYLCYKVFNNRWAFGGRLMAHQEEISSNIQMKNPSWGSWNYPSPVPNDLLPNVQAYNSSWCFIHNLSLVPISFFKTETENSCVGARNNISSVRFCSNKNASFDMCTFLRNDLGNIKSQFLMSPSLSSHRGRAIVYPTKYISSKLYPPSSSLAATGFPSNTSMHPISKGLLLNNTDQQGTCMDGLQFHPMHPSVDPHPSSGSNKVTGSLSLDLHQRMGKDEVTHCNKNRVLTCGSNKRMYYSDVPESDQKMYGSKKPKISLDSSAKKKASKGKRRELPLIKDMEKSFPRSVTSFGAKEEDDADLDLSLHL